MAESDDTGGGHSSNYLHQIGELTKSVSMHDQTLESLKEVPLLLKTLVESMKSTARPPGEEPDNQFNMNEEYSQSGAPSDVIDNDGLSRQMLMDLQFQDGDDVNSDDELLAGFQDKEKTLELGPSVTPQVAEGFKNVIKRPLSKQTLDGLTEKLKIPANCMELQTPKINTEIWAHLPTKVKINDLSLQTCQQNMAFGLITLANIGNIIVKNSARIPKDIGQELITTIMDGANMLGHGVQTINQKRRKEVKSHLQPDYAGICSSNVPVTGFLFGDDLKESLKSSKAAASVVRPIMTGRKFGQFRMNKPYSYPSANQARSGNRYRPPLPFQKRGGGSFQRASTWATSPNQHPRQNNQK